MKIKSYISQFKISANIILLLIIFTTSCASRRRVISPPELPKPIIVGPEEKSAPIAFKKVLIKIPVGTVIGYHHDGLARIRQFPYYWEKSVVVLGEEVNQIANEELRKAGYSVPSKTVTVFESSGDESWKAKFLLGGTISSINYHTYAPLAGNFSRGKISVEWEVFDIDLRRVVYKATTYGSGVAKGIGLGAAYEAFRDAIRNFLAEKEFHALLTKKEEPITSKIESPHKPILVKAISPPSKIRTTDLIQRAIQSVVTIKTEEAHGSRFVISEDGYVITNCHIILGQHIIDVILSNKITLQAEVVRVDQEQDLALLKIRGTGFPALPLGDSNKIRPGEGAFAISTPAELEFAQSVSKGVISGIRKIRDKDLIQTDVQVSPGSNGGPLINTKGVVVGIITLKYVRAGYEGLSFAIPINIAKQRLNIIVL